MSAAEELLNDLQGWAGLDLDHPNYAKLQKEQAAHIKDINSDMRHLFMDTDLGRHVLQVLMDWTIKKPVALPNESPNLAYFREGENNIVRSIIKACHASEVGK